MNRISFPRTSYCLCGDQAIFLDVCADRYFTLPAARNAAFLQRERGDAYRPAPETPGLLENALACRPIMSAIDISQVDAPTLASPLYLARTALIYGVTAIRLKRCGLANVLQLSANRRRLQPDRAKPDTYHHLIAAFKALAPIFGYAENCLPRSIAFHALAVADGHAPLLVIGVKRNPFAAHCWVQDGALVLNDTAEHVRLFTPILVI